MAGINSTSTVRNHQANNQAFFFVVVTAMCVAAYVAMQVVIPWIHTMGRIAEKVGGNLG